MTRTVARTTRSTSSSGRGATGRRTSRGRNTKKGRAQNRRDIQGLVLVALGLILGLGLYYTEATGLVGRAMADLLGAVVGRARYLVPPALLLLGFKFLRTRKRRRRSTRTMGEYVAIACLVAATFSALDLTGGRPDWQSSTADLSRAGGWAGVWIGGSFDELFGLWAEVILTFTLIAVAAVLLTPMSIGPLVDAMADRGSVVFDWARDLFHDRLDRRAERRERAGDRTDDSADERPRRRRPVFGSDAPEDDPGEPEDLTSETYIDLRQSDAKAKAKANGDSHRDDGHNDDHGHDDDDPGLTVEANNPVDDERPDIWAEHDANDFNADVSQLSWDDLAPEPVIEVGAPSVVDGLVMAAADPSAGTWTLPTMDLLGRTESQDVDRASVEATGRRLEHALAEHGVETRLIGVVVGPTVSRFELELGPGVKVARVTALHKDIAYAMATPDVRILAPIPGKQAIGVEVPNVRRQMITVGDLLVSEEATAATHALDATLGRDITGRTVMVNLAKMPHLLVAGQTGSGKSSFLNSMLTSILMKTTPDQVRLILVDPKRVELTQYERLPHLLTEVVVDPKKAANALAWAVQEMERRYDLLSEVGVRDLDGYNRGVEEGRLRPEGPTADGSDEYQKLSYILIVLDELADLMMVAARDVEESICRIAQKARAVGIHLVIATQRPSTNVITGLIKANVPARLAFAVSSLTDSRVILDQAGAERLVGKGDGLLNDGTTSTPNRFQGAWVTEEEVTAVVEHWIGQAPEVVYDSRVLGEEASEGTAFIPGGSSGDDDDDDLMLQAMELIVRSQLGSTSMLQRKLRVGFARAGRLMDLLEERGVVGPSLGSKPREVLMTSQELDDGEWPTPAAKAGSRPGSPPLGKGPAAPGSGPSTGNGTRGAPGSSGGNRARPGPGGIGLSGPGPSRPGTSGSGDTGSGQDPGGGQPVVDEPRPRRKTLADLQLPDPNPLGRPTGRLGPQPGATPAAGPGAGDEGTGHTPKGPKHRLPPIVEPDLEPDPELGLDKRKAQREAEQASSRPTLRVVEDAVIDDTELDLDADFDPALAPPPGYSPRD